MRPMRADRLFDTEDKVIFFYKAWHFRGKSRGTKGVGWAPCTCETERGRGRPRNSVVSSAVPLVKPKFTPSRTQQYSGLDRSGIQDQDVDL